MNLPGFPVLAVVPERGPDSYLVAFFNSGSVTVEADEVIWQGGFVRFYTRPKANERVLVGAYNVSTVEEVRELVDNPKEAA